MDKDGSSGEQVFKTVECDHGLRNPGASCGGELSEGCGNLAITDEPPVEAGEAQELLKLLLCHWYLPGYYHLDLC